MNTQSLLPLALLVTIGFPLTFVTAYGLIRLRHAARRAAYVAALRRAVWFPAIGFGIAPLALAIVSLFAPNPGIDSILEGIVIGLLAGGLMGFATYARTKPPTPTDAPSQPEKPQ